jgi:hypothetical protein
MLKEFDGAIGDKIVSWLEKFENWFDEREKVEGTIEPETRINTAVHNTKQTIFLTLRKHQNDYGAFATPLHPTRRLGEFGWILWKVPGAALSSGIGDGAEAHELLERCLLRIVGTGSYAWQNRPTLRRLHNRFDVYEG